MFYFIGFLQSPDLLSCTMSQTLDLSFCSLYNSLVPLLLISCKPAVSLHTRFHQFLVTGAIHQRWSHLLHTASHQGPHASWSPNPKLLAARLHRTAESSAMTLCSLALCKQRDLKKLFFHLIGLTVH